MSQQLPNNEELEARMREIAREEIASLAGLVVRRTADDEALVSRSPDFNRTDEQIRERLATIFGEALKDFGGSSSPGT